MFSTSGVFRSFCKKKKFSFTVFYYYYWSSKQAVESTKIKKKTVLKPLQNKLFKHKRFDFWCINFHRTHCVRCLFVIAKLSRFVFESSRHNPVHSLCDWICWRATPFLNVASEGFLCKESTSLAYSSSPKSKFKSCFNNALHINEMSLEKSKAHRGGYLTVCVLSPFSPLNFIHKAASFMLFVPLGKSVIRYGPVFG